MNNNYRHRRMKTESNYNLEHRKQLLLQLNLSIQFVTKFLFV